MRLPHVLRQEQQRRRYLNQGRWRLRVAARHSPFLVLRRLLPLVYPHRCRLVAATGKIAQTGGEVDRCQCTATDFPIAASDTFPDVPEPYTKRLRLYRKLLAGGPSLHCIIPTEGAPHPCVFCKGGWRCWRRNSCPFYTTRCVCRRRARPSQSTRRTGHPRLW